jgi:hypothetical protein
LLSSGDIERFVPPTQTLFHSLLWPDFPCQIPRAPK